MSVVNTNYMNLIQDNFSDFHDFMKEKDYDSARNSLNMIKIFSYNLNQEYRKDIHQKIANAELLLNKTQLIDKNSYDCEIKLTSHQESSIVRLEDSIRELIEIENLAKNTQNELVRQREIIEKSKKNIEDTNDELKKSKGFLNRMSKWWRG